MMYNGLHSKHIKMYLLKILNLCLYSTCCLVGIIVKRLTLKNAQNWQLPYRAKKMGIHFIFIANIKVCRTCHKARSLPSIWFKKIRNECRSQLTNFWKAYSRTIIPFCWNFQCKGQDCWVIVKCVLAFFSLKNNLIAEARWRWNKRDRTKLVKPWAQNWFSPVLWIVQREW